MGPHTNIRYSVFLQSKDDYNQSAIQDTQWQKDLQVLDEIGHFNIQERKCRATENDLNLINVLLLMGQKVTHTDTIHGATLDIWKDTAVVVMDIKVYRF